MRSSIREVAVRANVSAMTVSRVLNGQDSKVLPGTRERILKAIKDLDYVPVAQPAAQRRASQTHIIGLVFDQLDELRDYVGYETYLGLRNGAREFGYDLLSLLRGGPAWAGDREEVRYLDRRTDGLIFVNPFQRYQLMEKLVQQDIPIVCCGYGTPPNVANIVFDEQLGIRLLIEHLYQLGHRKIGFVTGPRDLGADCRKDAFLEAIQEFGLTGNSDYIFPGTGDDSWHVHRASLVLALETAEQKGITALMCANDYLAGSLARRATHKGLRIPQDIAITGVDDVPLAAQSGLTTLRHPFAERGRVAVEALVGILQGGSVATASRVVPTSLVVRQSTQL